MLFRALELFELQWEPLASSQRGDKQDLIYVFTQSRGCHVASDIYRVPGE